VQTLTRGLHPSGSPASARAVLRPRLGLRSFRAQVQPDAPEAEDATAPPAAPETEEQRGTFMGTKNFVSDGGNWFDKTTAADRSDRVNGDPLAPKIQSNTPRRQASNDSSRAVGLERESNDWYINQEKKRSMFGRTLNPLTGELQDKDEQDTVALNPFEDPIFYVILIVAMPVAVMIGAAQACLVPALSLAFGVECSAVYY